MCPLDWIVVACVCFLCIIDECKYLIVSFFIESTYINIFISVLLVPIETPLFSSSAFILRIINSILLPGVMRGYTEEGACFTMSEMQKKESLSSKLLKYAFIVAHFSVQDLLSILFSLIFKKRKKNLIKM